MERNYIKIHSIGSKSRRLELKVFMKNERRKIDSFVPYCDIFSQGKKKTTMRVNPRGNNKKTYNARDLMEKAHSFFVKNVIEKHYNLFTIQAGLYRHL